jgi:hypothetical protein
VSIRRLLRSFFRLLSLSFSFLDVGLSRFTGLIPDVCRPLTSSLTSEAFGWSYWGVNK